MAPLPAPKGRPTSAPARRSWAVSPLPAPKGRHNRSPGHRPGNTDVKKQSPKGADPISRVTRAICEIRGSISEIGRAGFERRRGTRRGAVSAPCALKGCPANGTFTAAPRGGCPCPGTRGRDGPLSLPQPPLSPPSLRREIAGVLEVELGIRQSSAQFAQGGCGDLRCGLKHNLCELCEPF